MAKDLEAKCKKCRRVGEKLFLKGERCNSQKCEIVKRNYPPGMHGQKGRKKQTDYALQLNEKQKIKKQYGMMEKQFRLVFDRARKQHGNVSENFIKTLEMRFDNVIYRAGFASSRGQARQLVNHGHFIVNDKKMDIPSYTVKEGDVIKIKASKIDNRYFKTVTDKLKNVEAPGWIHLDKKAHTVKILHRPDMDVSKMSFNAQMVVEYYSR